MKVLDVHGGDGAVGNGKLGAGVGTNTSGTQADVFDGPGPIAEAAIVADTNDFVGQNGDAAEEIFQRFLCGERDGNAADAQAGEHGSQVEAHDGERGQRGRGSV